MKTLGSLCLVLFAVSLAAADDADKKGSAFDPAKLVGTWKYVEGTKAGEKVEMDRLAGKVTFTKDTVTLPGGPDATFVMAYKIDAKKSPATIDLDIKDGPVKEGKAEGIIQVAGDELKICYVPVGVGKRPTKFESTKDNGAFLFVLKRTQ